MSNSSSFFSTLGAIPSALASRFWSLFRPTNNTANSPENPSKGIQQSSAVLDSQSETNSSFPEKTLANRTSVAVPSLLDSSSSNSIASDSTATSIQKWIAEQREEMEKKLKEKSAKRGAELQTYQAPNFGSQNKLLGPIARKIHTKKEGEDGMDDLLEQIQSKNALIATLSKKMSQVGQNAANSRDEAAKHNRDADRVKTGVSVGSSVIPVAAPLAGGLLSGLVGLVGKKPSLIMSGVACVAYMLNRFFTNKPQIPNSVSSTTELLGGSLIGIEKTRQAEQADADVKLLQNAISILQQEISVLQSRYQTASQSYSLLISLLQALIEALRNALDAIARGIR